MEKNIVTFPDLENIKFIYKKTDIQIITKNGQPFLFQGAKGLLNSRITMDTKYIWINYFVNTEKKQKMFNFLKSLESYILEYLSKLKVPDLNPFYYDMGIGGQIQNYNGKQILDIYRTPNIKLAIDDFPEKSYIIPLIWVQGLHYKHDRWYLNIKIPQLIVIPIFIQFVKCLIDYTPNNIHNDIVLDRCGEQNVCANDDRIMYKDHPLYGKYFKMIIMGVPKQAIVMKIKLELGTAIVNIMDNQPTDHCIIMKIKRCMHANYNKYFKMKTMGIPLAAIHHKMIMDNIDIHILNHPDELIFDIPFVNINNSFTELIASKQLIATNSLKTHHLKINKLSKPSTSQTTRLDMNELLSKRNKIMNINFI